MNNGMIEQRTWQQFRDAGLLWWINRILHLFGWAIVVEVDDNDSITNAYPALCRFRGFDTKSEEEGFQRLTKHMYQDSYRLLNDVIQENIPGPYSGT